MIRLDPVLGEECGFDIYRIFGIEEHTIVKKNVKIDAFSSEISLTMIIEQDQQLYIFGAIEGYNFQGFKINKEDLKEEDLFKLYEKKHYEVIE